MIAYRLRSSAVLIASAIALAVTGCGGGSNGGGVTDPTAEALSYVPDRAPLVVVASTDFEHGQGAKAAQLAQRFFGSGLVIAQLERQLDLGGLDFENDVKPLLGHDVVFSQPDRKSLDHGPLVIAVAGDRGKVEQVVKRQINAGKLHRQGSLHGADLYTLGQDALAVRGPVVMFGADVAMLRKALDLHASGDGLTPAEYKQRLGSLPASALVRAVGNVRALLTGSDGARARKIAWVDSVGDVAATVSAAGDGLHARFHVATDPAGIVDGDVPIATGAQSPQPAGRAPLIVGVRDLSHVIEFARRVARGIAPTTLRNFELAEAVIRKGTSVDLDTQVFGQLTRTTTILSDLHHITVRAEVGDAASLAKAVDRLQPLVPSGLEGAGFGGVTVESEPGDVYAVKLVGRTVARYGVIGGTFIVTTDPTADVTAIADAKPLKGVPRARGALFARVKGTTLAALLTQVFGLPAIARAALAPLGDATATVRGELDGLSGTIDLVVKR